jgi:hypothetical protein
VGLLLPPRLLFLLFLVRSLVAAAPAVVGVVVAAAQTADFPGTLLSTGTEDYFDSGWYFNAGAAAPRMAIVGGAWWVRSQGSCRRELLFSQTSHAVF